MEQFSSSSRVSVLWSTRSAYFLWRHSVKYMEQLLQLFTRFSLLVNQVRSLLVTSLCQAVFRIWIRIRIRIHRIWASRIRIHKSEVWILLPTSKNSKKNLDSYCFVTSFGLFIFEKWCKCTFSSSSRVSVFSTRSGQLLWRHVVKLFSDQDPQLKQLWIRIRTVSNHF